MDIYSKLQESLLEIIEHHSLEHEPVQITVKTLTPEEAIGNPDHLDYPLIKGRERMMQACFKDALGQAFTDMYGVYLGTLLDVVHMKLKNSYRRAIFVSTLNAVLSHLGMIEKTVHCRDDAPPKCARELASYISKEFHNPKIAMVGLQPRMVQALAKEFEVRVTDMDAENIGTEKFGITIDSPDRTVENLLWCDVALVTGTVFTNATLQEFLENKITIFYGVTVAGPAKILGLNRFCPLGI